MNLQPMEDLMSLEEQIRRNYQFVLIRSPHEVIHHDLVSSIFPKVINFKTEGYRQEYGEFVLPFDSSDFVATHLLLCEKDARGLNPVLGFKSVTLKKCDEYRIPFPMLGMVESSHPNQEYKDVVLHLMNEYRGRGDSGNFAYNGSFTILPRLRQDKLLMKHLWEITFSLLTNYYIEYEINHVIAICATKFNVHKKKAELGWNFVEGQNGILSAYNCRTLFDTSFIPMELKDVKEKSDLASSKFKDMWEGRLTLDKETIRNWNKKAA